MARVPFERAVRPVRRAWPACCLLLTLFTGCATFSLPFGKHQLPQASVRNPAVQIVGLWQVSNGRDPHGVPCRGLAGQVVFLGARSPAPLQVNGQVRIYTFDNIGSVEEQSKPLHQFEFDGTAWNQHLTESTLGASYSVFVPYMRNTNDESVCTVRIRFTPDDGGPVVFSDPFTVRLPGRTSIAKSNIIPISSPTSAAAEACLHGDCPPNVVMHDNGMMSRALRKTVIPMDGKHPVEDKVLTAEGFSNGAATPTPTGTTEAERLAQLEALLKQQQQTIQALATGGSGSNVLQASYVPEPESGAGSPVSGLGSKPRQTSVRGDRLSGTPSGDAASASRTAPSREAHPLAEGPGPVPTIRKHPLAD